MSVIDSNFLDLPAAVERSGYDLSTLRRHVSSGQLPAVKIKGRIFVRVADLDLLVAPQPVRVTDASLRDWAARVAAKAPACRPEQRSVIVSAFATAMQGA